jgi:hypothetical protein
MGISTTTNVHRVVGVQIERRRFSDWSSLCITLRTADGGTVSFDAFSTEALQLVDVPEITVKRDEVAA